MTALETLIAARALIERPENWTKYFHSLRKQHGMAYCAEGSIHRAGKHHNPLPAFLVFSDAIGQYSIPAWNDAPERTHLEVLAAFDAAIALERSRQQPQTDISIFRNILAKSTAQTVETAEP